MNDILRFQVTRSVERRIATPVSAALALDIPLNDDPIMFLDGLATAEQQSAMFAQLRKAKPEPMAQCMYMLQAFINPQSTKEQLGALCTQWGTSFTAIPGPFEQPFESALDDIDTWLCANGDQPSADAWAKKLLDLADKEAPAPNDAPSAAKRIVVQPAWLYDRLRLGLSLVASFYLHEGDAATMAIRARTARLVSVAALVEDIARGLLRVEDTQSLRLLIGTRRIVLPWMLMRLLKKPSNLARQPGMADLYVVRQSWWKYEPGEVAHIEAIMPHEGKTRIFERRDSTETLSQDMLNTSSSEEKENQSTSRFELTDALREASASNWYVNGAVNMQASYASVSIAANAGAGFDQSSERSKETARTETSEILSRAVSRVQNSVSQMRASRSQVQILDRAKHTIDNTDGGASNAIYRWVDKVNSVALWKYPHRFLIDLQIPEPAAWLRHVMTAKERADAWLPPEPGPFPNTFQIEDVSTDPNQALYYMSLAQQFAAELPPPPAAKRLAIAFADPTKVSTDSEELAKDIFEMKDTLSVPDGYVASTWDAVIHAEGKVAGNGRHDPVIWIAVGGGAAQTGGQMVAGQLSGTVGAVTDGVIPVTVLAALDRFMAVHIVVTCQPSAETMMRWRFEVFDALRAAQERRHRQWEELKAAQEAAGEMRIDGRSPLRNRELVRNELKRLTIELMTGQRFVGPGGMRTPPQGGPPEMDITIARDNAARIQFVEQAFEWSNLSYVPYPHYWATNPEWPELALLESEDPEFAAFLRSGSTRVIVPARPGFEAQAQLFLDYGLIWGGGPVPGPNAQDYVSVAEEIREMYHGPRDGELVETWDVRLPTSLVYIDPQGTIPLVNPDVVVVVP